MKSEFTCGDHDCPQMCDIVPKVSQQKLITKARTSSCKGFFCRSCNRDLADPITRLSLEDSAHAWPCPESFYVHASSK